MPLGGLVIGGIGALASGGAGLISAGNSADNAQAASDKAVKAYLDIAIPDPAEQKLVLERYHQTGKMDPRLEKVFQQAKTQMAGITTNPKYEDAQMQALASLQNEAENGGHTLAQDAYFNKLQQQVNAENRGREGAIEERFASRGMGGPSGLMLSAEEQNNQNMTEKENEASLAAAAQAEQNALQALQGEGNLAGQVRGQEFNEKANMARAQDSINQFNAQMSQGAESRNVAAQNQAQAYNVQEGQRVADQNTGVANYEQEHNKGLDQAKFNNEMNKAHGVAAADENQAGLYTQQGQTNANMWGNIGQGAIKTGAGIGQVYGAKKNNAEESTDW